MRELFRKMSVLYFFMGIIASGTDLLSGNITGFLRIFSTVSNEDGKFVFMYVICNLTISLGITMSLLKRCDQHMSMICYEFKKNNRYKLLYFQKLDLYKCVAVSIVAKFMIDWICMIGFHAFSGKIFIAATVSFVLTNILWLDTLYTLRLFKVSSNHTFFIMTICIFLSLLVQKYSGFTFFAYCMSKNAVYDCFIKGIGIILLQMLELYKIKRMDFC